MMVCLLAYILICVFFFRFLRVCREGEEREACVHTERDCEDCNHENCPGK